MSSYPGQVTSPPVPHTVPGQLDHHHQQQRHLQHYQPDHVVGAARPAHLLVVQEHDAAVTLGALHVVHVQDDVVVLAEELLDDLDVVTVAGPGVVSEVILTLPHDASFVQHGLQRCSVQLKSKNKSFLRKYYSHQCIALFIPL